MKLRAGQSQQRLVFSCAVQGTGLTISPGCPVPQSTARGLGGPGKKRLAPSGRARHVRVPGDTQGQADSPPRASRASVRPRWAPPSLSLVGGALGARTGPLVGREAAFSRRPQMTRPESRPRPSCGAPCVAGCHDCHSKCQPVDPGGLYKERTPGWSYSSGIQESLRTTAVCPICPQSESQIARTGLSWGPSGASRGVWVLERPEPPRPAHLIPLLGSSDTRHLTPNRPSARSQPPPWAHLAAVEGPPPCWW